MKRGPMNRRLPPDWQTHKISLVMPPGKYDEFRRFIRADRTYLNIGDWLTRQMLAYIQAWEDKIAAMKGGVVAEDKS